MLKQCFAPCRYYVLCNVVFCLFVCFACLLVCLLGGWLVVLLFVCLLLLFCFVFFLGGEGLLFCFVFRLAEFSLR